MIGPWDRLRLTKCFRPALGQPAFQIRVGFAVPQSFAIRIPFIDPINGAVAREAMKRGGFTPYLTSQA
jgi:hypothetical protein